MKVIVFLALFAVAVSASAQFSDEEYQFLFSNWMNQHAKVYATPDEFQYRFQVWKANMDYIRAHQSNTKATHTLAMNHYGDLTNDEFRARYNRYMPSIRTNMPVREINETNIPTSVDWRSKGVVTPVKNQGQCGSCWTFSTTGAVEGAHALATGHLVSLSEQELVDCSKNGGNSGCQGGSMQAAFQWIIDNNGICSESAYPYEGTNNDCKKSRCTSVATISSYHAVTQNSQSALTAAIAQQPVSVAVDAGGMDWQFYSGGIMSDSCGTQLDHGVLAAGYGSDNGQDYYLVKNSWGSSWGEQGYVRLARNTASSSGECGIAMDASYPIV